MKIIGSSLFLIVLPFVIIVISLIIFIPFVLDRYKSLRKEMKEKLREERSQHASCSRMHDIVDDFSKKARKAIEEDMGTEDLKKGRKELMDELKTKDIRDTFK